MDLNDLALLKYNPKKPHQDSACRENAFDRTYLKFEMLPFFLLTILLTAGTCVAKSPDPIFVTHQSTCRNATVAVQDPACWTSLGCDSWFERWKDSCPGSSACGCDRNQAWSDCALRQYQNTIQSSAKSSISCVDLEWPHLCQIPIIDCTKLSESQLTIAYASTAIGSTPTLS